MSKRIQITYTCKREKTDDKKSANYILFMTHDAVCLCHHVMAFLNWQNKYKMCSTKKCLKQGVSCKDMYSTDHEIQCYRFMHTSNI